MKYIKSKYILMTTLLKPAESFIIYSNLSNIDDCEKLKSNGKFYLRGNNFLVNNIHQFQSQLFMLSENSRNKTVQKVTNCYDAGESTEIKHNLEIGDYNGIFPTLGLHDKSNLDNIILKIKKHVGEGALKSFFLFFSYDEPLMSEKNDDDKEITKIKEFYDKPNFRGIIETDCKAKLTQNNQHSGTEYLIIPGFRGMIIYSKINSNFQEKIKKGNTDKIANPLAYLSHRFNTANPEHFKFTLNLLRDSLYQLCKNDLSQSFGANRTIKINNEKFKPYGGKKTRKTRKTKISKKTRKRKSIK